MACQGLQRRNRTRYDTIRFAMTARDSPKHVQDLSQYCHDRQLIGYIVMFWIVLAPRAPLRGAARRRAPPAAGREMHHVGT